MARARNAKGQFLKRGSTAMARRGPTKVAKRRSGGIVTVRENITVRQAAPAKRSPGRVRRAARAVYDQRLAIGVTLGAAGYGYICTSPQTAQFVQMLPTVDAIGPHLSRGAAIWFLNKHLLGNNKHVAQVALGALAIGGFAFGKGAAAGGGVTPAVLGGAIGDGDDLVGDGGDDLVGDDEDVGDYDEG